MRYLTGIGVILIMLLPDSAFAQLQQQKFSVSGGGGMMYYLGDLTDKNLPRNEQLSPFIYLAANRKFSNVFSLSLAFMRGKVQGADSLTGRSELRDFHFRSPVSDFHLLMGVDLKGIWRWIRKDNGIRKRFDHQEVLDGPRIMLGGGMTHFNPEASYNGKWYNLQPLGTEGQRIGGDYPDPYKRWTPNIKLGGEIGFRIDRHVRLDLFGAYTILFTDYLDDVSGEFPDYNELIEAPNGNLASRFTYRLKSNPTPVKGAQRGNPDQNDSYLHLGIKITYCFSRAQLDQLRP